MVWYLGWKTQGDYLEDQDADGVDNIKINFYL
jgi:hypothetical protein